MEIIEEHYGWAGQLQPRDEKTTQLVLHHEAGQGSAQDIHGYHLSLGWSGIAYHYYVRRDGRVYRGRPEIMRGGHTEGWNNKSIGVCFEGNFEQETMGEAQKRAGLALVADIACRYRGITVCGHRELCATACPGKNFPLEEMKAAGQRNVPSDWAKEAVGWAIELGLIRGDENGDLQLRENVTLEKLLVILHRWQTGERSEDI